MAKSDSTKPAPRAKRRVKPVESVREQRSKLQADVRVKPRRFQKIMHLLGTPFRWVGGWNFWQSKAWKPFRFVGKIIAIILFIPYIRNSFAELKLVTWPDWKQSWRLTWAVLVFSVFFGVILAVVDFSLDKLFKQIILNS